MAPESDHDQRDHVREPFFWLFLAVAVVVAVLAVADRRDDAVDASFVAVDPAAETATTAEPVELPTPTPTPVTDAAPAVIEVAYSPSAITISGVAPAAEVAEAVVAAATELVGEGGVTNESTVDTDTSFTGGVLVLNGEVADPAERRRVVAAFSDLGLTVDDRMVRAGSNLTIAQVLAADPELSEISDFLAAAGVLDTLDQASEEGFTLFAPTNDAVRNLDSITFDELGNADDLTEVLQYHLVAGRLTAAELATVTAVSSQQGESIAVDGQTDPLTVGGAALVGPDLEATNGIVHVIDAVLLPGTLRTEVALNELVTLEPVLFASGSAVILDESLPILDQAAQLLADNPLGRVEVQGHTDTEGPAEVNLELSQQRADAVRQYLIDQGIEAARLTATGYGETELKVDPEEDDDDRAANRRIEFRVS